jgi:hypothetical protein
MKQRFTDGFNAADLEGRHGVARRIEVTGGTPVRYTRLKTRSRQS